MQQGSPEALSLDQKNEEISKSEISFELDEVDKENLNQQIRLQQGILQKDWEIVDIKKRYKQKIAGYKHQLYGKDLQISGLKVVIQDLKQQIDSENCSCKFKKRVFENDVQEEETDNENETDYSINSDLLKINNKIIHLNAMIQLQGFSHLFPKLNPLTITFDQPPLIPTPEIPSQPAQNTLNLEKHKQLYEQYVKSGQTDSETIDKMLKEYLLMNNISTNIFERTGDGIYSFGTRKVYVLLRNGFLVIRVGGGYMYIEEFLKVYMSKDNEEGEESTPKKVGDRKRNLQVPGGEDNVRLSPVKMQIAYDASNKMNGLARNK